MPLWAGCASTAMLGSCVLLLLLSFVPQVERGLPASEAVSGHAQSSSRPIPSSLQVETARVGGRRAAAALFSGSVCSLWCRG